MINVNNNANNKHFSFFAKDTIFENSEWVCKADLCSTISECAEIVNQVFERTVYMSPNGEIRQLENGILTPEERLGLARIFNENIHRFKFMVSKNDFDNKIFSQQPWGARPYFNPDLSDEPQEILFSVKYFGNLHNNNEEVNEGFRIEGMLYDYGKGNLLSEHWDEGDKWLYGSFDKDGNVIGTISAH